MEGQGKRLMLAVVLALGVYMLWMLLFPPDKPAQQPTDASGTAAVATHKPAETGVQVCTPPKSESTVQPDKVELAFPGKLTATFSKHGGTLASWKLAEAKYAKDWMKGELLPQQPGHGAFTLGTWRGSECLPTNGEWQLKKLSDTQVEATFAHGGLTYTKTFTVDPASYSVRMQLKVVSDGAQHLQELTVSSFAFNDPAAEVGGGMQVAAREWSSSTFKDDELLHTPAKELQDGPKGVSQPRMEVGIQWTGFEHPYLLAGYAPRPAGEPLTKHTYAIEPYGMLRTDIRLGKQQFDAKTRETTREVFAYLGPKNYNQLKAADELAQFPVDFAATIDLGWFAFIGRPLMWLLLKFYSFAGNWAIAIIMLTFLVKGLTLYWTTKSMRSMKQMAALAPKMKELQEKYKNDRQRIQAETMALYKQHQVNPIAGCLPILLQMPVWIALYRMLSNAGELYLEPFIPGWIDDLTNTDPFHILPVVLLVTMFVQARLTPTSGDSRQQKIMLYGMPLMFGVMSFFFPAGLTLYIFTNTVLSALHSIYMNKYDKKSLAIAAQIKKANEEAAAAKEGKKPVAKPVIDVESNEKSDDDEGEPDKSGAPASRPHQQRKRPKKRRR